MCWHWARRRSSRCLSAATVAAAAACHVKSAESQHLWQHVPKRKREGERRYRNRGEEAVPRDRRQVKSFWVVKATKTITATTHQREQRLGAAHVHQRRKDARELQKAGHERRNTGSSHHSGHLALGLLRGRLSCSWRQAAVPAGHTSSTYASSHAHGRPR